MYISTLTKNKDAKTNSPAAFSLPWAKLVDHQLLATSQRAHPNHHLPAAIRAPTERNVMGTIQPQNPPPKKIKFYGLLAKTSINLIPAMPIMNLQICSKKIIAEFQQKQFNLEFLQRHDHTQEKYAMLSRHCRMLPAIHHPSNPTQ